MLKLKKPYLIAESDDDNIPKDNWGEEISFDNKFEVLSSDKSFFKFWSFLEYNGYNCSCSILFTVVLFNQGLLRSPIF